MTETLDQKGYWAATFGPAEAGSGRKSVERYLRQLLGHMLTADGILAEDEVRFLNGVYGTAHSQQQWKALLETWRLENASFASEVPELIRVGIWSDTHMRTNLCGILVQGIDLLGTLALGADGALQ